MSTAALDAALRAVCPIYGVARSGVDAPWTTVAAADGALWRIDYDPSASDAQRQAAQAFVAGWTDPAPARQATGRQLRYALNAKGWRAAWDAALSASRKPDDVDYWATLGSGDAAPEANPKLRRIAAAGSPPVDLKALFDAALAST